MDIEARLRERAAELLSSGQVEVFVGYRQGSNPLRTAPFAARTPAEAAKLVWNPVCLSNLAGVLRKYAGRRVGALLKPCDARTVAELVKLHQLNRQQLYVIGVACWGMANPERIAAAVAGPVTALADDGADLLIGSEAGTIRRRRDELLLNTCTTCSDRMPHGYDEVIGEAPPVVQTEDRFAAVQALEALDTADRLAFWREQFSRCTLCYACQAICPLCFCKTCPLLLERDDPRRHAREPMTVFAFHLMRAYHLAERCTGCDACERVCPEAIPLSLIYRKLELERERKR